MQRTYSRKGASRRARISTAAGPDTDDTNAVRSHKRQRTETDSPLSSTESAPDGNAKDLRIKRKFRETIRKPVPTAKTPSPPIGLSSNAGHSRKSRPSTKAIRSTPASSPPSIARTDTLPDIPAASRPSSPSPRKAAKDLSSLFTFAEAPSSVAKRMLRRTGTDSSASGSGASFSARSVDMLLRPTPVTPTKLAKTKSESMIDLTYGSPRSGPLTPSKSHGQEDVSSPPVQTSSRPTMAASNVRTYGGKSRSFLVALPATHFDPLSRSNTQSQTPLGDGEDAMLGTSQEDDFEIRESYTDLRNRWGVDNSEDDPRPVSPIQASPGDRNRRKGKGKAVELPSVYLPPGMHNDVKSITELRSKGENRRFLDDVGYLFEGLEEDSPLSVRRGSALEIVTKFCDTDFARKAKAADFLGRAWDALRQAGAADGDKVLDSTIVSFAALVSRDAGDLVELATKSDLVSVLYSSLATLDCSNDPLWLISCSLTDSELKKAGVSKLEKTLLADLHRLVRKKSGLMDTSDIVSNRVLISIALSAVPPLLHSAAQLPTVLKSLTAELSVVSSRVSAYETGLSLVPSASSSLLKTPSLLHILNCLHLLDSSLLGRWANHGTDNDPGTDRLGLQREAGLGAALMTLCVACDVISREDEYAEQRAVAAKCLESTLRVLINLTHDDLPWCQALLDEPSSMTILARLIIMAQSRSGITQPALKNEDHTTASLDNDFVDDSALSLDLLCLALGLLTNLVQVSHEAKEMAHDTLLDFKCPGKRACTRSCRCSSRQSALVCLAFVYLERCKTDNEIDPFVRGHMAVLFGLLMQQCPANQRVLLDALPGTSDKQRLNSLVEHAREFTLFYVEFTKKVSAAIRSQIREEEEDDEESVEVSAGVGYGAVLRDTRGETVAKDVIVFLERFRDQRPVR